MDYQESKVKKLQVSVEIPTYTLKHREAKIKELLCFNIAPNADSR